MPTHIYHLTTPDLWDAAQAAGEYRAPSLAAEGFIHASTIEQLGRSANRFYARLVSVIVLKVAVERIRPRLAWEDSPHSADPFPHLYGPLNLDAVEAVWTWEKAGAAFRVDDLGV